MGRKNSRVLVTGGAGFIGSHIVDRLLNEGYRVSVVDNFSTGSLENLVGNRSGNLTLIKGDIRDSRKVRLAVKGANVLFHEAALVSPVLSTKDPRMTEDINVKGTLNLLEASMHFGVDRFILASSAAVYGNTPLIKMKESALPRPTTPYGISKLACECYLRAFHELYGIETVSLRYFNVYGPKQSVGDNAAYSTVIPIFANRLSKGLPPTIHGDGKQSRDFVYVEDVVEANMLAMRSTKAVGEVINIGSGKRIAIDQISMLLKELTNKRDLADSHLPPRLGDVRHGYADISKARKILGYEPRFSIQEGLRKFLEWYDTMNPHKEKDSNVQRGTGRAQ